MEYNKIQQMLKRYSFEEKMRISQVYSKRLMSPTGLIEIDKMRELPLPWELETFLLFSVTSMEWKDNSFAVDTEKDFVKAINSIKNYTHPVLEQAKGTVSFVDKFIIAMGAVQFDIQEYYPYKFYRYNFYFSFSNEKINMPKLFQEKFGCSYADFIVFAQFLWLIFADRVHLIPQQLFEFLQFRFSSVIAQLSLTRAQYIAELNSITDNISDYLYCLRPSYTYPFIIEQHKLYLPLPHLLIRSVTSSLMYRLTEGKNELTNLIGKEVLEPYLYQIIKESSLFDEVFSEQEYYDKKRKQRTLDVMARKDNCYIFFDSKMHAPKRNLRILDQSVFETEVRLLADNCKQIYLHIRKRFPLLYNPFSDSRPIDPENIYGLVVVRDDPHIRIEHIYQKAAELLEIDQDSVEFNWLCRHVGITAIYEIEKYCFTSSDIISTIFANSRTGRINDFWLTSQLNRNTISNIEVRKFKQNLADSCISFAEECKDAGVLDS